MDNQMLNLISSRRSHRAYQPVQIEEEQLNAILKAAEEAPSARNTQPWHITVVKNQQLLDEINEAAREGIIGDVPESKRDSYRNPAYHVFYHAPVVLIYSCQPIEQMRYAQTDCGISIENAVLAAEAMGLGSVILGLPRFAFTSPKGDEFRTRLGIPEGYDFLLAVSIGVPNDTKEAHKIKPDRINFID